MESQRFGGNINRKSKERLVPFIQSNVPYFISLLSFWDYVSEVPAKILVGLYCLYPWLHFQVILMVT